VCVTVSASILYFVYTHPRRDNIYRKTREEEENEEEQEEEEE
jgi:hypothetical protein